MSSPGSAPIVLELPAWPLADTLALGLVGALGIVVEAVMVRQPQGVTGAGLLLALALIVWFGSGRRASRRIARATMAADGGWRLTFADGRAAEATMLPGTRVLGSSVLLKWRADGRPASVWLTHRDLPRPVLRALTVRLQGSGPRVGA